ncbi:tetraacyldisaccharide 4 -kinase : Tetraacyldisaccharide 4'-kinase OS=Singulisphaera acidiphila (strain ATCC BAA-1392 / DSM 18658 / VKM B-2454 / MOB10) GN=lpxK PE=3 SV=1: LpxK [Gemmata massiliana]|uniref:Tetraacyldisaccharide 4'-kinase n=1 Tax=Gemmata massiliana TaxID=1210884 RepID=A0A6P2DA57_9BACT|nr:tetraacyldisaccharide 4'-kinase [Gemmata massiliana]VTR97245.1 tetraacyldisaccharide 4 -kinase : Tetraacyldisaccharide 4'-kinase OS=Singulisphaera acidiphila (strain ATCC BAA-1392 / DSM 18658 / VKM B-2454 / MOB10) GN=lpxK PE=3 SV=1: LpxK [Gemmata massiliana]
MFARAGLRVASWPYGLAMRARNRAFDRGWNRTHTAAVPVVSVGNLTLGGTGKTPCVEWVARFFRERDQQVTILSRGYGAETGRNDEAMVLEENLPDVPHLQDSDRVRLAETAVEELEAELLVLDDGFQHRRLHRDLDIVLIDTTHPPMRDYQFPRGTLREPASGLRRAGAILLTRCDQIPEAEVEAIRAWVTRRFPQVPIATTEHRPTELVGYNEANEEVHELVESLGGKTVGGFCGIGNPVAFRHTLESLGACTTDFRTFPDHHAYTREDVDDLNHWAARLPSDAVIVTTQKDWVKLRIPTLGGRPLRAVRIGLHFRDGEAAFAEVLERVTPTA